VVHGYPPPEWPANLQGISQEGLALLGIDEKQRALLGREALTLTHWQKVGALMVTVSAVIAAVSAAASPPLTGGVS
jgi:hypothetical protein